MAVIPSVLGDTLVVLLKMLIRTRNRVTSRAMRPGTTCTITNNELIAFFTGTELSSGQTNKF